MWFRLAFGISFLVALTVAAKTARLAARRHGGALNQPSRCVHVPPASVLLYMPLPSATPTPVINSPVPT